MKASDDVEELLANQIGQTVGLSGGDPLMSVFVGRPMPIVCLHADSDFPTREEMLLFRLYQEFAVVNCGESCKTVERRRGIPFSVGINTEVWSKGGWHGDGKWRYRRASWDCGFSPKEGCPTIMELVNCINWSHWPEFANSLTVLFPLITLLDNEGHKLQFTVEKVEKAGSFSSKATHLPSVAFDLLISFGAAGCTRDCSTVIMTIGHHQSKPCVPCIVALTERTLSLVKSVNKTTVNIASQIDHAIASTVLKDCRHSIGMFSIENPNCYEEAYEFVKTKLMVGQ